MPTTSFSELIDAVSYTLYKNNQVLDAIYVGSVLYLFCRHAVPRCYVESKQLGEIYYTCRQEETLVSVHTLF